MEKRKEVDLSEYEKLERKYLKLKKTNIILCVYVIASAFIMIYNAC